jgi:hypothetical protein
MVEISRYCICTIIWIQLASEMQSSRLFSLVEITRDS